MFVFSNLCVSFVLFAVMVVLVVVVWHTFTYTRAQTQSLGRKGVKKGAEVRHLIFRLFGSGGN